MGPLLLSANALWDHRRGRFRLPSPRLAGADIALDSAGFVAMIRYGGYRWPVQDYAALAAAWPWAWWAAMDYCCEPEIAADRGEVIRRVHLTAERLADCIEAAEEAASPPPMPVLQGREPDDYALSAGLTAEAIAGRWPALVGVGSVCRRAVHGPDGLFAVVARLDRELPPGVRLHLFGVKGAALARFHDWPRVASTDSQAWDLAARWRCRKSGESCTAEVRAEEAALWLASQERARPAQLSFLRESL
jgi:hypothetical protein